MCMVCQVAYGAASGALLLGSSGVPTAQLTSTARMNETVQSKLSSMQQLPEVTSKFAAPDFDKPDWYEAQEEAEAVQQSAAPTSSLTSRQQGGGQVVTYTISTKGATSSDLGTFSAQVNETLNDPRGWAQLGVSFQEVATGGNFNFVLSEASQVPTFSSGCSAEWSCRVGPSVVINDIRWSGATPAWNAAGGDIRNYRHMVVNHEVGHWLGHGHLNCTAPGASAPVMQQQSIDLQGCVFNPWPHASELWSTTLGIR